MKKYILILLLPIMACMQISETSPHVEVLEYQKFEINPNRDTILESKRGVKIKIAANTFEASKNKNTVQLEFSEIFDKSEMVLNN